MEKIKIDKSDIAKIAELLKSVKEDQALAYSEKMSMLSEAMCSDDQIVIESVQEMLVVEYEHG